jgi:hypothetical protein
MKLKLHRKYLNENYTIGHLYEVVNGVENKICDCIEDKVRNLPYEPKVYGETAIPYGTYEITLDVISPKFSKYPFYQEYCNGRVPRLLNVPHFSGILIHCAEGAKGANLVQGCIGVGLNTIVGGLTQSKEMFIKVNKLLKEAKARGEQIWIQIV